MPSHDAYLRLTPYERLLPEPGFADAHFPGIRAEAEHHPEASEDPGAFALLESSRRALAELRDPEGGGQDHGATHALLLFHAFHLHSAGAPHLLVTVPVSRWAVEGGVGGDSASTGPEPGAAEPSSLRLEPPSPSDTAPSREAGPDRSGLPGAIYVQLPQHLFWIRDEDDERPVSLDGFFWTIRGATLHLLGIGGLQGPEGEGFRVLPLPGVPRADAPLWLQETMRESGDDFRSEMPGAELEGLYELRTAGELLKLAARIDSFVGRFPQEEDSDGEPDEDDRPSGVGPQPGTPPYTRITLT